MKRGIELKKIEQGEQVEGIVIDFGNNRSFAIEEYFMSENGSYIHRVIDHFEINSNKKIKNYQKTFQKELSKHISSETKIVYIKENVLQFLERLH